MKHLNAIVVRPSVSAALAILVFTAAAQAQPARRHTRQFPPGAWTRLEELPAGRLRMRLESLPAGARDRALMWLRGFHFTELDVNSLRADAEGAIYYADHFPVDAPVEPAIMPALAPDTAAAAVPVQPFPAGLRFHSRPGAPNVIYLCFAGDSISGTAWNTELNRTVIPATPFSTDSDLSTFSDTEQTAIKRIWQRVAEDYAPFDVDVTTERPAAFTTRTAEALITRNTDANGRANPSSSAGGISYVNVFGNSSYAYYRPCWIYHNNLGNSESSVGEATTHEVGHNLGLSHDGKTDGTEYHSGFGTGEISWGPIMGAPYGRNVTQWSKGEYYLANNTEDDLAKITGKLGYATDTVADSPADAAALEITGTNVLCTTSQTDPQNLNPANKGVLERNNDLDVFSFTTGNGPVQLSVNPWIQPAGSRGGNLDLLLELHDASGMLIATNNPAAGTSAQLVTNLAAGTYYLHVRNSAAGNPFSSVPAGYTAYGSIGQYFITGYVAAATAPAPVHLTATVNNPDLGSVSPTNGLFDPGTSIQVLASPAPYCRFLGWTNDATGTANPLSVTLQTNLTVEALFEEILTTNHPTPLRWLASCGYTNDFENAVEVIAENGVPLWQSYVAGLNPQDATSRFTLNFNRDANGVDVLSWNTATGRVYTLWCATNLVRGFTVLPGAVDLPATVRNHTNAATQGAALQLYRIQVRKP